MERRVGKIADSFKYAHRMRLNPEGIVRSDLPWALTQRRLVMTARRIDACLLCRRKHVNDAGLCDVCMATLEDHELPLVEKWLRGTGP